MNRKLLLLCATLGLAGSVSAAVQEVPVEPFLSQEILNDPAFIKAVSYNFAPNLEVEPKFNAVEQELFQQVQPLLTGDQPNFFAALDILEEELRNNDKVNAIVPCTIGNIYWAMASSEKTPEAKREEYTKKAQVAFEKAVELFPNYLRAYKALSQLANVKGDHKAAQKAALKTIQLGDNDPITYGILGYTYYDSGKFVSAEATFRNALVFDPNNKSFRELLGRCLLEQSRYNEANALFEELIQEEPEKDNYWLLQVNTYLGLGETQKALLNLEVVRKMGKASPQSLKLLGDIYAQQDMIGLSYEAYMEALKTDKTNAVSTKDFLAAANTLVAYGANAEAINMCNALEKKFGSSVAKDDKLTLLTIRSSANIRLGNGAEAAKNLEDILDVDPYNGRALLTLADYLSQMVKSTVDGAEVENPRDRERAIYYYERAENHPEDSVKATAFKGHGQMLVKLKEYDKAAAMLREALSLDENNASLRAYLDQVEGAARNLTLRK
ncbi:MAG: tetratricopeptide repeat protein [Opitutales bacterium]|nr:tetratricopeptide repeat protein [Opitutales bacterium]